MLALGSVQGCLRLTPLLNYYEVVDPVSLEPAIADADGVLRGEMVATHLYQGAKPLVRYRTGDMVRLYPDARIEVLGRAVDRLLVNEVETNVYDLEDLLLDGVSGFLDHRILIDRRDGRDVLTLVLTPEVEGADPRGVAARVAACREAFDVVMEVLVADAETVIDPRGPVSWKRPRIHDRRASG